MGEVENKDSKNRVPRGVLLVCYSPETLGALVAILQQAGETALAPQSLRDAWECVRGNLVGCVILDLTGPAGEAMSFFRAARSFSKSNTVPFLFLISSAEQISKLEPYGTESVTDQWLVLPSSADAFLDKVRSLLVQRTPSHIPTFAPRRPGGTAVQVQPNVITPEELLKTPGVFSGALGVLDVTKILSMVEPLRLTGVLNVSDGKRYGQIHFVEGAVRHAELHDIEGADALFLLFHLKTGAFRFDLEQPTPKKTIVGNTMALLLEGLRQMDEAKAIIKSFRENRPTQPPQNVAGG
ncbi:MAG TPA: DUF4388 domain-containing protein [Planctomycetota bacterium]|nr:DUF4388 domain-containing protein [Planctomycetota bacterium]